MKRGHYKRVTVYITQEAKPRQQGRFTRKHEIGHEGEKKLRVKQFIHKS